jgi:zinc protease
MRHLHLVTMIFLACSCTKADPASSPSSASGRTLPKIQFEKYTLANGLDVILHTDDKMPAVNVNLWYHVGSKDEEPGRTGFAHLFEHMMFQGSKHARGEYLSLAERAGAALRGGGVNGTTDQDRTNYFETVPTSSLAYALWLESDRMGFLLDAVDKKSLDNQRDVVANEKRQGDNRPYGFQRYLIAEHLYPPGHPYGHATIGSIEDLNRASLEDVQNFFKKFYTPNNASLVLSGAFDVAEAKQLVAKYFGPLPSGESITRPKKLVPELSADKLIVRQERVPQAKLTLVWHTPPYFDPDDAPLILASEVLGGGKNSRLYRKLIREEKLASNLAIYVDSMEITSAFYIEVIATPGASLDRIKELVLAEIKAIGESGPADTELTQKKAAQEYQFVSELERIGGFGGKADRLNRYNTFLGNPDMFQADFDRFQVVSKDDVAAATKRWLVDRHHLELRFVPDSSGRPDQPEFDRSVEPSLAGKIPFNPPTIERRSLSNGLELYVINRPALPKVEAAMVIKSADVAETEVNAGASHLAAVTVTEGTSKYAAEAIAANLEALGATVSTEGSKFGSAVGMSTLKRSLDPAMEMMAELVVRPTFPATGVELAKKLRIERIGQEKNNPANLASELFPRILFAGHAAGVPDRGTEASIAALTPADLKTVHETFWRPNNAALILVGDVTVDEGVKLAERHFGTWAAKDLPQATVKEAGTPQKPYIFLVDKQGAPQSQIRIGSVAPARSAPDYVPIQVMNTLFGGNFSSRLNLNLREDKGYAYGAFSAFNQTLHYGYWFAGAGVQTPSTVASLIEFKKEIDGMAGARPVSDTELADVKKNLSRSYLQNFETLSQVVRQVAPLITANVPLDFLTTYVPDVLKLTPADVMTAGGKYMDMNRVVVLVVGDLSIIEKPIMTLGWGEAVVLSPDGKVLRKAGAE